MPQNTAQSTVHSLEFREKMKERVCGTGTRIKKREGYSGVSGLIVEVHAVKDGLPVSMIRDVFFTYLY